MQSDLDEQAATTDLVRVYLNAIGKIDLLDAGEEVDLAQRIEAGLFAGKLLMLKEQDQAEAHKNQITIAESLVEATKKRKEDGDVAIKGFGEMMAYANQMDNKDLEEFIADGEAAKTRFIEANLRLVVSIAKRYSPRFMTQLDIIQEGNAGLVRAVEKFDFMKGYKFSTYATWWIRQAISRAMAQQERAVRLPNHVVDAINVLVRTRRELTKQLNHEPSIEELAKGMGVTPDRVQELMDIDEPTVSLDKTVGEDDDAPFGNFVMPDVPSVEDQMLTNTDPQGPYRYLECLEPQERLIVELRTGNGYTGKVHNVTEIARFFDMSPVRVRRIFYAASAKMRAMATRELTP
jgi:RNA polymerase primary sigma factor/RNA polymerase nonessential primary-like sigma factor